MKNLSLISFVFLSISYCFANYSNKYTDQEKFQLIEFSGETLTSNSSSLSDQESMNVAKRVLEFYRKKIEQKFGYTSIELIVDESNSTTPNAWSEPSCLSRGVDNSSITLSRGGFNVFSSEEILPSICHEIGHFLGQTQFISSSGEVKYNQSLSCNMAYEGEADYFSGNCILNYLLTVNRLSKENAINMAATIAINDAAVYANRKVNSADAENEDPYIKEEGVRSRYPSNECRLLTVLSAIYEKPRPKCWFNP